MSVISNQHKFLATLLAIILVASFSTLGMAQANTSTESTGTSVSTSSSGTSPSVVLTGEGASASQTSNSTVSQHQVEFLLAVLQTYVELLVQNYPTPAGEPEDGPSSLESRFLSSDFAVSVEQIQNHVTATTGQSYGSSMDTSEGESYTIMERILTERNKGNIGVSSGMSFGTNTSQNTATPSQTYYMGIGHDGEEAMSGAEFFGVSDSGILGRSTGSHGDSTPFEIVDVRPSNIVIGQTSQLQVVYYVHGQDAQVMTVLPITWDGSGVGMDGKIFERNIGTNVTLPISIDIGFGASISGLWEFESIAYPSTIRF